VQLFDTSKRDDPDGPHYQRQGGRRHLIVRHDLLLLFSNGALTAAGQLSIGHALFNRGGGHDHHIGYVLGLDSIATTRGNGRASN
jgi:hypothetical protein